MLMYIVDQNVMRRPYLAEIIGSQPDAIFIVPDIALVEMSKSHEWESTMRSSFQALSVVVDKTFLWH